MFKWSRREEPPERPILEQNYLKRLSDSLGEVETAELLGDAMIELAERLPRLNDLADTGDAEKAEALVHDIAGIAGHMGLSALSGAAADAQRALREGTPPEQAVAPVISLGDPSLSALGAYCRRGSHDE